MSKLEMNFVQTSAYIVESKKKKRTENVDVPTQAAYFRFFLIDTLSLY